MCRFDPLPSLGEESNWDRIELEVLDPTHVDVVLQSGGHHQVQQYLGFLRALSLGGLNNSYLTLKSLFKNLTIFSKLFSSLRPKEFSVLIEMPSSNKNLKNQKETIITLINMQLT